ncbi:PilX N-terminal domain-containing pilus assembly protein [Planctomycetota bacterium]
MIPNSPKFAGGKNLQGMVLLVVLGVLALMSVLAITFVRLTQLERAISKNYVDHTQALLCAESGVDYAVARIQDTFNGVPTAAQLTAISYQQDDDKPGLEFATKVSFNLPDDPTRSGIVSSSYVKNGDYFKLRVADLSGRLNINDSNGLWNIDTDPYPDSDTLDETVWTDKSTNKDYNDNDDIYSSHSRLQMIFEKLVNILFPDDAPEIGVAAGGALFSAREQLPGNRFSNWSQVTDALVISLEHADRPLLPGQFEDLKPHLTLHSWQDPNVIRPTFQLEISRPDDITIPSDADLNWPEPGLPPYTMTVGPMSDISDIITMARNTNIYLYSDFQTQYFEKEPRAPVNVNTCSQELLESLITPVRGHFLYEGPPCSLMDAPVSPWIKAMRASSYTWADLWRQNGYWEGTFAQFGWRAILAPHKVWGALELPANYWQHRADAWIFSPSGQWFLGNETRYGVACLTGSLGENGEYEDQNSDIHDGSIASLLSAQIYHRIHGTDLNGDGNFNSPGEIDPQPFQTWDEFTRFIYEMVDPKVRILHSRVNLPDSLQNLKQEVDYLFDDAAAKTELPPEASLDPRSGRKNDLPEYEPTTRVQRVVDLSADMENNRFPYRLADDVPAEGYQLGSAFKITGFSRYMADAVLANFNPNSQLNDFNPDSHIFRHVDKSQLTQYTAELCFQPTGTFSMQSLGLVSSANNEIRAEYNIETTMKVFYLLRHTTQAQYMTDYEQNNPNSIYEIFHESGGSFPTAGADISSGTGVVLGKYGPSLVSYPEPIRVPDSLSIDDHPYGVQPYFSKYDGYLMLSTYQLGASDWNTPISPSPRFMAPMGYRSNTGSSWKNRSLGLGGLLPVKCEDINSMFNAGGRGVMLIWDKDYTMPPKTVSSQPSGPGDWPSGPSGHGGADNPWQDRQSWVPIRQAYSDHVISYHEAAEFIRPIIEPPVGVSNYINRLGWNMPADAPLTPHVKDTEGNPVKQVQGVLYPDGAFSEAGRLLAYRSKNLGDDILRGREGTLAFWVKPNWDTGYSNRIRQLFSIGHVGKAYTHALDMLYFPSSPSPRPKLWYGWPPTNDFNMIDPPFGGYFPPEYAQDWDWAEQGAEERLALCWELRWSMADSWWPQPTHSFLFGWCWNGWYMNKDFYRMDEGIYKGSQTATDFFPFRDEGQQNYHFKEPTSSFNSLLSGYYHPHYGFYGHQWNLFGMSYRNRLEVEDLRSIDEFSTPPAPNADAVRYSINGVEVMHDITPWDYGNVMGAGTSDAMDIFWEESPHYIRGKSEPPLTHIGEGYMRFGWCEENGGPVSDCTYDDIVTWGRFVGMQLFNDPISGSGIWNQGRYLSEELDNNVIALYTSPVIDLYKEFAGDIGASHVRNLKLHSVYWTLYWPRFNWRPGTPSPNPGFKADKYNTWGNRLRHVTNSSAPGIEGVDVDRRTSDRDPVTGDWDPITMDIRNTAREEWIFSGDTDFDDNNLFSKLDQMPARAGGSSIAHFNWRKGDDLRYRVYFHLELDQMLLESPVFDDITFVFIANKPQILSWRAIIK